MAITRTAECTNFLDFEDLDVTYGERLLMRSVGPGQECEVVYLGEEVWLNDERGRTCPIDPPTARERCRTPINGMQTMRVPSIPRGALLIEVNGKVLHFPWEDIIFVRRIAASKAA